MLSKPRTLPARKALIQANDEVGGLSVDIPTHPSAQHWHARLHYGSGRRRTVSSCVERSAPRSANSARLRGPPPTSPEMRWSSRRSSRPPAFLFSRSISERFPLPRVVSAPCPSSQLQKNSSPIGRAPTRRPIAQTAWQQIHRGILPRRCGACRDTEGRRCEGRRWRSHRLLRQRSGGEAHPSIAVGLTPLRMPAERRGQKPADGTISACARSLDAEALVPLPKPSLCACRPRGRGWQYDRPLRSPFSAA